MFQIDAAFFFPPQNTVILCVWFLWGFFSHKKFKCFTETFPVKTKKETLLQWIWYNNFFFFSSGSYLKKNSLRMDIWPHWRFLGTFCLSPAAAPERPNPWAKYRATNSGMEHLKMKSFCEHFSGFMEDEMCDFCISVWSQWFSQKNPLKSNVPLQSLLRKWQSGQNNEKKVL